MKPSDTQPLCIPCTPTQYGKDGVHCIDIDFCEIGEKQGNTQPGCTKCMDGYLLDGGICVTKEQYALNRIANLISDKCNAPDITKCFGDETSDSSSSNTDDENLK